MPLELPASLAVVAEAIPVAARSHPDVFVLDTSALLRLYLADRPLPPSFEPALQRGCRGDALLLVPDLCLLECALVLLKQVQRQLLSADDCRAPLADVLQLPSGPSVPVNCLVHRLIKPWPSPRASITPVIWLWLLSTVQPVSGRQAIGQGSGYHALSG